MIVLALLQAVPGQRQIIFFDWGKSEITHDSSMTLDEIAREYRDGMRIQLVGHSDRSGSEGANGRSSLKRAEAVRHYLARQGIPYTAIAVSGAGESAPIIATADGVREVQNRRVEIVVVSP